MATGRRSSAFAARLPKSATPNRYPRAGTGVARRGSRLQRCRFFRRCCSFRSSGRGRAYRWSPHRRAQQRARTRGRGWKRGRRRGKTRSRSPTRSQSSDACFGSHFAARSSRCHFGGHLATSTTDARSRLGAPTGPVRLCTAAAVRDFIRAPGQDEFLTPGYTSTELTVT